VVENGGGLGPDFLRVDVNLDASGYIREVDEVAFAHIAMGRDASGCANFKPLSKLRPDEAWRPSGLKASAIRIDVGLADGIEFLSANSQQFIVCDFFHALRKLRFSASGVGWLLVF